MEGYDVTHQRNKEYYMTEEKSETMANEGKQA